MDKPYVLLVDDNEATCTLLTALLRRDYEVEVAADGAEAIESLRTKTYAAVLLDLLMPQVNGFDVLEFIQQNNPPMLKRVLVLSAALSAVQNARLTRYAVCAVISKPFEIETLLTSVKECTGQDSIGPLGAISSGVILLLADILGRRLM